MTFAELARQESAGAKRAWAVGDTIAKLEADPHYTAPKRTQPSIAERVKPYIGSGMQRRDVAEALGCSEGGVSYALNKLGATL
jgi:hypothetical protein